MSYTNIYFDMKKNKKIQSHIKIYVCVFSHINGLNGEELADEDATLGDGKRF